jgi:hypothetical protein
MPENCARTRYDAYAAVNMSGEVISAAVFRAFRAAIYRSSSQGDDDSTCMARLLEWSIEGLRDQPIGDCTHHLLKQ